MKARRERMMEQNSEQLLSYLGLMKRAGALAAGAEDVVDSALHGRVRLILTARDTAPNTLKWLEETAARKELDIVPLDIARDELGGAVGAGDCACVGVKDSGFAVSLCERMGLTELEDKLRERQAREKRRLAKKLAGRGKGQTPKRGK